MEEIVHAQQTAVRSGVLCSEYGAEGESLAGMCIVSDGDAVGIAVPCNAVDARYLAATDAVDGQFLGCGLVLYGDSAVGSGERAKCPIVLAFHLFEQPFGQGDSRAAGMVEFMDVVHFLHASVVLWELVHDACQIAVYSIEDGYADGEIRSPEEGLAFSRAEVLHLLLVCVEPSCGTGNNFDIGSEAAADVVVGNSGRGKFNGDISAAESLALKVLLVIYIDATHNLVTASECYLLYHTAHLAVSD